MTVQDFPPGALFAFASFDFRAAWDALAGQEDAVGRGNFMFGREAVGLLELICRVCETDTTGAALREFSDALLTVEPRYFTPMPGSAPSLNGVTLPSMAGAAPANQQLIALIFDLVRNGQAHQRQQIMVTTTDNGVFGISLTGATYGRTIATVLVGDRGGHLAFRHVVADREVFVLVRPEVLFLDLEQAADRASTIKRGLSIAHLVRPRSGGHYSFDTGQMVGALTAGGHPAG